MLNLFGPVSAFVAVGMVALAVAATYYLRPSRGEHANPRGAAITVAMLRAQIEPEPPNPVLTPGSRYGLLCGYAPGERVDRASAASRRRVASFTC